MALTLTWDLFIAFFAAVVTGYSYIIGKHQTLKILIAVYIAVLATQGVGNILMDVSGTKEPVMKVLQVLGVELSINVLSSVKLGFFMFSIILIALKGGFDVSYGESHSSITAIIATGLFGVATSGIIMLSLITFIAGAPILDPELKNNLLIQPLMNTSTMIQILVLNQNLWFCLPALLLVGFGLVKEEDEDEDDE